jgi:nucleotide-binding universal stress UspA family protein
MKRVLVPIDFSEASMSALEFGLQLANLLKANLRVMHVNTGKHYAPLFEQDNVELRIMDQADGWLEKIREDIAPRYKVLNGNFDVKLREGNVTKEIANQAKYDDSSLIVVGAHGISGFEDKWVGSNAYRLVSNAPCPVLLVRKGMKWADLKHIVMPIDLKKESRYKVPAVAGIATLFGAKITVAGLKHSNQLFILNRTKAAMRQVEKYITETTGLPVDDVVLSGKNLPQLLLDHAKNVQADLIAVGVHHDSNLFADLIRPFVNDVINYAECPVLVVPSQE